MRSVRERPEQLAHHYDRVVTAAHWRRTKAAKGQGYRFEIPKSARRPKR